MSTLQTGAISFEHVSKRYRLGGLGTLRGFVGSMRSRNRAENPNKTLWALRDVSFHVAPGDSLGLIGPNGAGKTTALKLLSSITQPTEGRIAVEGRMSSLIELGAGFHPELTGRENIYLNGAILGLKRAEVKRKFDEIIAFSELERFIDTPVKRYSSGMYVRLAFAVAASAQPDILLVDEVLAVGDARFRSRCMQRIAELRQSGTTIVLVSHNMHQVRQVCASAILLMNGQVAAQGAPSTVIARHDELMLVGLTEQTRLAEHVDQEFTSSDDLVRLSVEIRPVAHATGHLSAQTSARVTVSYCSPTPVQIGRFHVAIYRSDHTLCCVADSASAGPGFSSGELHGNGFVEITYEPLQLTPEQYYVIVQVTDVSDAAVIASGQSPWFTVFADTPGDHNGVFVPTVVWKTVAHPPQEG